MITWVGKQYASAAAQFAALPPSLRAFLVAQMFAVQTVFITMGGVGWSLGHNGGFWDWHTAIFFFQANWFGGFIALVLGVGPYYHAQKGIQKPD